MASRKENMLGVIFDDYASEFPIVDSHNSSYYIPFFKDEEYFSSYENYIRFIKAVESNVRKHPFYKKYISYLVNVVGMNTCQVLSNIQIEEGKQKEKLTIEMHHGPILTLFDICCIVTNYLIAINSPDITTFHVANIVLEEHRLNNVRVVLLTKTVHDMVHADNIMLNYNMGFGDTATFLKKYGVGVDRDMRVRINKYIKWSQENDSFDNGVLEVVETMKSYGNNDFDEFDSLDLSGLPDIDYKHYS